jgi:DNA-binding transcriptional LysR family regulator
LCLPESSFRTRQLLQTAESNERVSLQPSITCNSITLLKSLLGSGEFFTLLPVLAVSKEVENRQFAAVPIDSTALQDAAVQLISRLGRRLPPAPSRMLSALTTYLQASGGTVDLGGIGIEASVPP